MKKNTLKKWISVVSLAFYGSIASMAITKEEALQNFVNLYPEARLVDVYKSFYQDNFGPGHLLGDSVAAKKYFLSELQDTSQWGGPVFEFTGEGKNFVRLNMDLVRKGIIPAEAYFKAFQNSVGSLVPPSDSEWISYWTEVDSLIQEQGYHFPNEIIDKEYIREKLASGNFPIHHSDEFNDVYNFHYRIIALPEYEKLIEIYSIE